MPHALRPFSLLATLALLAGACAPAAPSPTAAPPRPTEAPKPAPTAAPARSTEQPAATPPATPAAKPAPTAAPKPAAFDEKAVADFYKGKTVKIMVGFAPGGSFDVSSRILAKAMQKYLPGNPNFIIENKPGAGTILAANLVYNTEPKDGTVIASVSEGIVLAQAIGTPGIEYDVRKFNWLGSGNKTFNVCVARNDSGIGTIVDLIGGTKELIVGTTGPGSAPGDVPAVLSAALGARIKRVSGYDGIPRIRLATEAKEVDGFCQTFDTLTTVARGMVEGPNASVHVIVGMGASLPDHPFLKGVPAAESLAKTDEARLLLRAIHAPAEMTRPLAVAPEVPPERVAALRRAFDQAFRDPETLAELQKAGVEGVPSSGEEVTKVVQGVLSTPPEILARLKEILK